MPTERLSNNERSSTEKEQAFQRAIDALDAGLFGSFIDNFPEANELLLKQVRLTEFVERQLPEGMFLSSARRNKLMQFEGIIQNLLKRLQIALKKFNHGDFAPLLKLTKFTTNRNQSLYADFNSMSADENIASLYFLFNQMSFTKSQLLNLELLADLVDDLCNDQELNRIDEENVLCLLQSEILLVLNTAKKALATESESNHTAARERLLYLTNKDRVIQSEKKAFSDLYNLKLISNMAGIHSDLFFAALDNSLPMNKTSLFGLFANFSLQEIKTIHELSKTRLEPKLFTMFNNYLCLYLSENYHRTRRQLHATSNVTADQKKAFNADLDYFYMSTVKHYTESFAVKWHQGIFRKIFNFFDSWKINVNGKEKTVPMHLAAIYNKRCETLTKENATTARKKMQAVSLSAANSFSFFRTPTATRFYKLFQKNEKDRQALKI